MIDAKSVPAVGGVDGWNKAKVSKGDIIEFVEREPKPYERYYVFWVVESVRRPFSPFAGAQPGNFVIAQYYRNMATPHPPPLRIETLRRLSD